MLRSHKADLQKNLRISIFFAKIYQYKPLKVLENYGKIHVLRELHTLEETTMDKVRFLMSDTGAPFTAACREALEQKGVDVTVVEKDGNKVLQKMLTVRPQVVLLDAFMPGLDALAVKQRYNAAGERHTSFFVTGAFQSEEMVQELLDEGFAYYFVKPFERAARGRFRANP